MTQARTVLLAECIFERYPGASWKIALLIARHQHDPQRRPVNSAGNDPSHFIDNIVAAYIRHNLTNYDPLFHCGYTKEQARKAVQAEIDRYLTLWRAK